MGTCGDALLPLIDLLASDLRPTPMSQKRY